MNVRSKLMFRMIERRKSTALIAFVTDIISSWNGTTAHARLSPGAAPGRWSTTETSSR